MNRFFSTVSGAPSFRTACLIVTSISLQAAIVRGQDPGGGTPANSPSGYYTDPGTGIVYRKVTRTVETPVTETKMEKRTQTVYKPQTVTETRPMSRTVYTPIIENRWEPRVHGRWNPFVAPTVAYHHVPKTHWSSRQETVQQTQTKTQWVPENRTVEVPTSLVRMQRQEKVDFEPVGRVAPPAQSVQSAIASRLRPLQPNQQIAPVTSLPTTTVASTAPIYTTPVYTPPRIAASTIGRLTSDPPRRNLSQGGLRANELVPARGVHGTMLR